MQQVISVQTKLKILVLDDHEAVLDGTVSSLRRTYADADILTAQTAQQAQALLQNAALELIVVDLSIPATTGEIAKPETGIQFLRTLMQDHPTLNIVVQSAHPQSLVRLKPAITNHQGGFTIADKSHPLQDMLTKVEWALRGVVYTPREMRTGLEVKPEWMTVLRLAFQEGLQDKAIAERMSVSERTVRHYWTQVQDALEVYPDAGKNIRIQTEMKAREIGLVD